MSNKWTKEQLAAINEKNGNILVSAAAGSGRTAVLVERIIKLITDEKRACRYRQASCRYVYKGLRRQK